MDWKKQIPNRKVGSALGYGMPIAYILGWLIKEYGGVDVPPGVSEAMGVLISGFIAWAMPEKKADV